MVALWRRKALNNVTCCAWGRGSVEGQPGLSVGREGGLILEYGASRSRICLMGSGQGYKRDSRTCWPRQKAQQEQMVAPCRDKGSGLGWGSEGAQSHAVLNSCPGTYSPILPMAAFPAPKWPHEHQQAFPWPPPWHLCLSVLSGGFVSACCPLLAHWIPQFKSQILYFLVW